MIIIPVTYRVHPGTFAWNDSNSMDLQNLVKFTQC